MTQLIHITLTQPPPNISQSVEAPAQKPSQSQLPSQTHPIWIHPHLQQTTTPAKGRQFLNASDLTIPQGECLLIDRAYALIPVVDHPATNDELRCSNPRCNRPCLRQVGRRCSCLNGCVEDVAWCSLACRESDAMRHGFECAWLKRFAGVVRAKWGEYTFGMLWVVVRLLANRYRDRYQQQDQRQSQDRLPRKDYDSSQNGVGVGWPEIDSLCGSIHTWPHEQVRHWTVLVKKYLQDSPILSHGLSKDRILHSICQEEANSFGLYPRETGVDLGVDRGEQFAAAVYPTAAIANHSCSPNISHKPDDQGRMVFTACRDILPGEECCIAYFDLTQYRDLGSRRDHLRRSFQFLCRCERCLAEEPVEEGVEWMDMPVMDDS